MNVRLEITISIETLRQLSRDDLPGTDIVDIERAREKHPVMTASQLKGTGFL